MCKFDIFFKREYSYRYFLCDLYNTSCMSADLRNMFVFLIFTCAFSSVLTYGKFFFLKKILMID